MLDTLGVLNELTEIEAVLERLAHGLTSTQFTAKKCAERIRAVRGQIAKDYLTFDVEKGPDGSRPQPEEGGQP